MGFHWPKKGFHWPTNIFSSFSWSWFPPPWWRQRWLRSQVIIFPFSNLSKVRCLLIHDHLNHQVLATCKSQPDRKYTLNHQLLKIHLALLTAYGYAPAPYVAPVAHAGPLKWWWCCCSWWCCRWWQSHLIHHHQILLSIKCRLKLVVR